MVEKNAAGSNSPAYAHGTTCNPPPIRCITRGVTILSYRNKYSKKRPKIES